MYIAFDRDDLAALEALQEETLVPMPLHPRLLRRLMKLGYVTAKGKRGAHAVTEAGRTALRKFHVAVRRATLSAAVPA